MGSDGQELRALEEQLQLLQAGQERIRAQAEQVRQRYAFLAEASAVLSSSLDYDTTLSAVAELAVRQMADWCLVGIAQPDGTLKRLALAHKDPVKVEWRAGWTASIPRNLMPAGDRPWWCERESPKSCVKYRTSFWSSGRATPDIWNCCAPPVSRRPCACR